MARSVGVTISAVVVFIGSAFTLLCGALAVFGALILALNSSRMPNMPINPGFLMIFEMVFFFGLGGWGIASGIGLIKTRPWARICMLVFAAILIFVSLPAGLVIAFVPFPTPNNPDLPANFGSMMRVGITLFYGALAALAGFWLYFFNKTSVKAQFNGVQAVLTQPLVLSFAQTPAPRPAARPISITIIGWFLLVGSALAPLFFWYSHQMAPRVPIPFCFLGFFLVGWRAVLVFAVWMAAQVIAAVGLLKLRNWGRLATIALQLLGVVNGLLIVVVPANRARFQGIMESMMTSMNARMPQPAPFTFPAWLSMATSIPVFLVILWFLVTRKQAFTSAPQDPLQRPIPS